MSGGVVRTACPYCGVGCGVAGRPEGRALEVAGDEAHPSNFGRLCSKGSALGATVGLDGRLLTPVIGRRAASWDEATALVARRFRETIARHGPDSVAFYVSGQLLTEDYYAANKLMKGFIGSGNIDTNSRLCMASAVVAHKQAFGADLVPGCYEDLDLADLVVFSGHNAAWTHPVLFRRMEQARARGQRHVVIDPRRTDTAEVADLHLPLAPQTDVRLWNGLLAELDRRGALDADYIAAHVAGFAEVKAALAQDDQSPAAVAADCGVPLADLQQFFDWFAQTPRSVSLFSMGANQSAQGVAKGLAILNVHLATGRIGKPGACPFSITGQPNAMGGRETGGMATTLAGHMDFDEVSRARVARFWGAQDVAPRPGLKAIDMFDAIAEGKIKALWVMATNPAVSLPNATKVRAALAACPFVVVSDCMAQTDTMAFAHVKLPALAWGEKDGTVTNSERRISRQRRLFDPPGEARADWRIIADVAGAMGHREAFDWRTPAQVFREWARLTNYENQDRMLSLGPLAALTPEAYEALEPVQWPVTATGGTARLFEDGVFQTPDGRARMVVTQAKGPAQATDPSFPLALNTGRVRDHWHTLTRTGLAPDLCRHTPEPYVEMHPADAEHLGVVDGALARVQTAQGEAVALAKVTDRQRPGAIFMPMHWTQAFAPSGRANPLVAAAVDPQSGQPEFKHTPARVRAYRETWRGFFIARESWSVPAGLDLVWRRIPQHGCQLHEFAGRGDETERETLRRALSKGASGEPLRFEDVSAGSLREAYLAGEALERVLFTATSGALPPRDWLAELFARDALTALDRAALLIGRAPGRAVESAPLVCACRGVRADKIGAAIEAGAGTVDAVSDVTGAGSSCGSCRPEIARIIAQTQSKEVRHAA
ncbi:nitrate reductase [Phenylobacterium sp. Root77]|uniref:nitrate reductase n=1 Tax=unclassified Phenylobacterium TaxID=2640670 RepID=UPI0006FC1F12|nr:MULTISPECIES: nitrate reductase [unclassified Phenylobacterium]KQW71759.1 nitrate reductase [Phenylobacterium sp. Root1277]KQW94679.1 nitrate reductase [Phenylobacterium sp. Root1290]KRC44372.1 nitrate reductase [Phenylobacterium sp. Root77]